MKSYSLCNFVNLSRIHHIQNVVKNIGYQHKETVLIIRLTENYTQTSTMKLIIYIYIYLFIAELCECLKHLLY
jgi:hypothetical protein